MMTKKRYTDLNLEDITFSNKEDLVKYITKERTGYIRLEMVEADGSAPGSKAVLEIWPPFHCSPVHNHGDAYGVIKVLSGAI